MATQQEVAVTPELLARVLELAAGTEMILIGGQALAFWTAYYRIAAPTIAITKDVDLIGTRADVERLARGLGGRAAFANKRSVTLLVGQVLKNVSDTGYVNIDVMFRPYGDITAKTVAERAVTADNPAGQFRVMHPIDVLQSRLENVHGLVEKQDEHGVAQLRLAIDVTREFVRDVASQEGGNARQARRPAVLRHFSRIETMALSDAGRKVARRYGVHVADAIDPALVQHVKPFMNRKLPQLMTLMSPSRRAEMYAQE